ncbi:unnamed protein product [Cunninghamella blakesleeana]
MYNKMTQVKIPERLPKLIVFDLDKTLWNTWIDFTSGPPFTFDEYSNTMNDRYGDSFELFKHITKIFAMIKGFPDTKIAIASRSSTPDWATTALKTFQVPELGCCLYDLIDYIEIYPSCKTQHFAEIHEASGIPYEEMLFFDDERRNIVVKNLGVHFILLDPSKGVTLDRFQSALKLFEENISMNQTTLQLK